MTFSSSKSVRMLKLSTLSALRLMKVAFALAFPQPVKRTRALKTIKTLLSFFIKFSLIDFLNILYNTQKQFDYFNISK
jgi:hypothetical protein